jgi:Spy/CpxP family protein refolding chaperone
VTEVRKLIFIAFILIGFLTSGIIYAYEMKEHKCPLCGCHTFGEKMMHNHPDKHISCILKMKDKLKLTSEQVSKLKAIAIKTKKQCVRDEAELKLMKIDLYELLSQDPVNISAIDSQIDKIARQEAKIRKNCIHAKLNVKKILTPEQLKILKEHLKERKHHGKCIYKAKEHHQGNPGQCEHKKSSPKCKKAHEFGECQHPKCDHEKSSAECKETHKKGKCKH